MKGNLGDKLTDVKYDDLRIENTIALFFGIFVNQLVNFFVRRICRFGNFSISLQSG